MSLHLIVFAGFYAAGRHAVRYADTLAQALRAQLVLLHVEQASFFDLPELAASNADARTRQADTAAALQQLAQGLHVRPLVELATDLLPAGARDLASRYAPALFVLSPPDPDLVGAAAVTTACAGLLQAGNFPLLVVPAAVAGDQPPRRFLIASDGEPFTLAATAGPWRQLLPTLATHVVVAHVSDGAENDATCGAALQAVQASGLLDGLANPELRGYDHRDFAEGLLAAVADTQADVLVLLARPRSFLSELFHRSVTARLLERCPVPVLLLPVAAKVPAATFPSPIAATVAQWTSDLLAGIAPVVRSHPYMPKN